MNRIRNVLLSLLALMYIAGSVSLIAGDRDPVGALSTGNTTDPEQTDLFVPFFRSEISGGAENGGIRDEFRERGRTRASLNAGLDLLWRQDFGVSGIRFALTGSNDRNFPGEGNRNGRRTLRPGEVFAFLRIPAVSAAGDHPPDSNHFLPEGENMETEESLRIYMGRKFLSFSPEGFLFQGEAPLFMITGSISDRSGGPGLHCGGLAQLLEREEKADRPPEYSGGFASAFVGLWRKDARFTVLGGFYRRPGRASEPDLTLLFPGDAPVALPTGQSGRSDRDVRYYGLRFEVARAVWRFNSLLYRNEGREIAVARDGTRIGDTRRDINGTLLYASLLRRFNGGQRAPGCPDLPPFRRSCVAPSPITGGPELEGALLLTTRDRDREDRQLRGFGSLRPEAKVMGGAASIFLSGLPPSGERPPLHNYQPGGLLLEPSAGREKPETIRDNGDPAPPAYDNTGLRMGSLRLGMVPAFGTRLDFFVNYADFLLGDGVEGIISLGRGMDAGPLSLTVYGALTAAAYRQAAWERDELTGLLRRPPARFYRRILAGLTLRF